MEFLLFIIIIIIATPFLLKEYFIYSAKTKYDNSLQELRKKPENYDLKSETIALGREYARLVKDSKMHNFSEQSITNDLSTIQSIHKIDSDSALKVEVTNHHSLSGVSASAEIEKLAKLFIKGVITSEEFERGKTLFLGASPDKAAAAVDLLKNLETLKSKGVLTESEFNMKKWEILSERLLPGKHKAAKL